MDQEKAVLLLNEALLVCDRLYHHVKKVMDFGERECPLCKHHYEHDSLCPFRMAKGVLRETGWLSGTEE